VNQTSLLDCQPERNGTGVAFTDAYPVGLVNAASPTATTNCPAGGVTASTGGASLAFSGGTLPANGSCTVTVGVTSAAVGTYANSTGPVTTANAGTAAAGSDTLTVLLRPTIAKAFSPAEIPLNATSTLTLTLTNANGARPRRRSHRHVPGGVVNTTPASIATRRHDLGTNGGNAVSLASGRFRRAATAR
jgi:hypothetical protein